MKMIDGFQPIKGFKAYGLHSGIKKDPSKKDLMVIHSELPAVSGNVFTQNVACAAPIQVSKVHGQNPTTQAIVVNSGNANACTGEVGLQNAKAMAKLTADGLGIAPNEVIVASTGIIGVQLPMDKVQSGIPNCLSHLSNHTFDDAAEAILTTDTFEKKCTIVFQIADTEVTISGMAKGSGMIHPNMATMLGFFLTDLAITKDLLQMAVSEAASQSFNMISVDGDTSTNDMVSVLANGAAGNPLIEVNDENYACFKKALNQLMIQLAKLIAKDGEGATKLLEVNLTGAPNKDVAVKCAKSVIASSLVKAAFFGNDANWGRIVCAMGYAGVSFNMDKVDVSFKSNGGTVKVFEQGSGLVFDEALALDVLQQDMVQILIEMNDGDFHAQAWGCDLTYEYVKINGEYRS